jgi:hypothetical protein
MTLRTAIEPWTGLVAGVLVTGAVIVLFAGGILPPSPAGIFLSFAGGLTAGLFIQGPLMKGALAGAACGCLAVVGMVIWMVNIEVIPGGILPILPGIGGFALIMSVFFVPSNTVSGIIGVAIRKWSGREPFTSPGQPENSWMNGRYQWTGILLGSLIIGGSVFLVGSLNPLQIIPPLAAGFIAGFLSRGGTRAGFESGLITGFIGVGINALLLLWISLQATGFVAGLAGIVLVLVALVAVPTAVIGGIIGAVVNLRIFRSDAQ